MSTTRYEICKMFFGYMARDAERLIVDLEESKKLFTDEEYDQYDFAVNRMIKILRQVNMETVEQCEPKKKGVVA
ncbi:MAG: hypothetical protein GX958_11785 [Desulfitobacterium sp.]|nr:hypothetical protein [Desulfitobacterium sp.]